MTLLQNSSDQVLIDIYFSLLDMQARKNELHSYVQSKIYTSISDCKKEMIKRGLLPVK